MQVQEKLYIIAQIREWLGFTHFSVGRDHAGSDNFYDPKAATKTILIKNNYFNIKILNHDGAYFCKKCKKVYSEVLVFIV